MPTEAPIALTSVHTEPVVPETRPGFWRRRELNYTQRHQEIYRKYFPVDEADFPTTAAAAEGRFREEELQPERDEAQIKTLVNLQKAFDQDETVGGAHGRTVFVLGGASASVPLLAAAQRQYGKVRKPVNPETGKHEYSGYKAWGIRILTNAPKKIRYEGETYTENTFTAGIVSRSEGDPVLGPHDKIAPGPVELAFGEMPGVKVGTPPMILVGTAVAFKYPTIGHIIQFMGPLRFQFGVYIGGDARLDKLKKKAAKVSAIFPQIRARERFKSWRNKRSGPTLEEELENIAKERVLEPV